MRTSEIARIVGLSRQRVDQILREAGLPTKVGVAKKAKIEYERPEYKCWWNMIDRCHNENNLLFRWYGARGISVCDRWRMSFSSFLSDIGRRPSKAHSIDRKNNDGNYEPGNCRWATKVSKRKTKRKANR